MRESALEKADSALEQPQGHYRVPIVDPTYVFGRSEWDLNLWDVVCYCRHRARVAEFETEDLVAWLRGKHYTDERNAIRKAFQFALVRALERGLLIPVLRTGEPVDDLADPLAVLRFFTEEGIFTLDFPAWSSKVQTSAPSFSKPCGYLENGWVGATPAAAKAILNLLMYALKDGHTSLRIDKVYDFLGNYMMRKRIRTGIGQLIGLQLISIQRDRIVPRLNRLLEQAPTERTKSSLSDMLANILEVIGKKADPVQASHLVEVLRRADLLRFALRRPQLLRAAYRDMRRFTEKGPSSALVLASRRWADYPLAGRRWAKVIAHATGLYKRLKSGTDDAVRIARFHLSDRSHFEITPLTRVELQRIDFDRAEILVEVASETDSPRMDQSPGEGSPAKTADDGDGRSVTLRFTAEDGEDNPIAEAEWAVGPSEQLPQGRWPWFARLDVTDALKRARDRLGPDDIPLLQTHWRSTRVRRHMTATAVLKLRGARYLPPT